MKQIQKIALFTLLAVAMVSCHKERDITVNTHFYVKDTASTGPLTLYVKGEPKGILPRPSVAIDCATAGIDTLTLSFPLRSGSYDLTVRDAAGNSVHQSRFTVKENSVSGTCHKGGQGASKSGDCFIVDIQTEAPSGT